MFICRTGTFPAYVTSKLKSSVFFCSMQHKDTKSFVVNYCALGNMEKNFNFSGCVFFISHICLLSRERVRNCTSLLLMTVLESQQNSIWHLCGLFWRMYGTKNVAFKSRSVSCKWEGKSDEGTCIDCHRES